METHAGPLGCCLSAAGRPLPSRWASSSGCNVPSPGKLLVTHQVDPAFPLSQPVSEVSFIISSRKVAVEPQKMVGFLASEEEEFNLGPEMRLDHSELLCHEVLLKYKRDRESF